MNEKNFLIKLWSLGILFIVLAYFFIDRPVADFIHQHDWRVHLAALKNIVEWPPVVEALAPLVLLMTLLFQNRPLSRWQLMLISLCISVLLTYFLKNDLKWIFSRYWPETWKNNNLSWINNHMYGFQWFQGAPFQGNDNTGSFPSGHSTIAFASLMSIGLYYRRLFYPCLLLACLEGAAMVAFNYHFISDVIAGACLGITCAILVYSYSQQFAK